MGTFTYKIADNMIPTKIEIDEMSLFITCEDTLYNKRIRISDHSHIVLNFNKHPNGFIENIHLTIKDKSVELLNANSIEFNVHTNSNLTIRKSYYTELHISEIQPIKSISIIKCVGVRIHNLYNLRLYLNDIYVDHSDIDCIEYIHAKRIMIKKSKCEDSVDFKVDKVIGKFERNVDNSILMYSQPTLYKGICKGLHGRSEGVAFVGELVDIIGESTYMIAYLLGEIK